MAIWAICSLKCRIYLKSFSKLGACLFFFTYFTDIEHFRLSGGTNSDILIGGDGNDRLFGGRDRDVLAGGAGIDWLSGGIHDDIFVLNLTGGEGDEDIVIDFGTSCVCGNIIRVDTADSDETTTHDLQDAANIRWTNNTNYSAVSSTNDADIFDTIIYATQDTANDISDDVILMVLEDFTEELTMADFEVV